MLETENAKRFISLNPQANILILPTLIASYEIFNCFFDLMKLHFITSVSSIFEWLDVRPKIPLHVVFVVIRAPRSEMDLRSCFIRGL
jgi:hypothetical protein